MLILLSWKVTKYLELGHFPQFRNPPIKEIQETMNNRP